MQDTNVNSYYSNNSIDVNKDIEQVIDNLSKDNIDENVIKEKIKNISNYILNTDYFDNDSQSAVIKNLSELKTSISNKKSNKLENIVINNFSIDQPNKSGEELLQVSMDVSAHLQKLYGLTDNPKIIEIAELVQEYKTTLDLLKNRMSHLDENQIHKVEKNIENAALRFVSKFSDRLLVEDIEKIAFHGSSNDRINGFLALCQTLKKMDDFLDKNRVSTESTSAIDAPKISQLLKYLVAIDRNIEKYDFFGLTENLYKGLHIESKIELMRKMESAINNDPQKYLRGLAKFAGEVMHKFEEILELFPRSESPIKIANALVEVDNVFSYSLFLIILKSLPLEMRTIEKIKSLVAMDPIIDDTIHANYRVRLTGFNEMYNHADQQKYSELMYKGVVIGSRMLEEAVENKSSDSDPALQFLSMYRQLIATTLKAKGGERVGVLREDTNDFWVAASNCAQFYSFLGDQLKELLIQKSHASDSGYEIHYPKSATNPNGYDHQSDIINNTARGSTYPRAIMTTTGTITDESNKDVSVPLSRIVFYDPQITDLDSEEDAYADVVILHTSVSNAKQVMSYVSKLSKDLKTEKNENALMEKLGEIFWWICQAKPWVWGDPSIAELFIRSLWLEKTKTLLPPWKENFIPWAEVVTHFDVNKFKREFHSFFDSSFGYVKPKF